MQATTIAGGQIIATVPDICKTVAGPAVVPIPYPNFAMPMTGQPAATQVLICSAPALTKSSRMQPTNGDQPGASGGGGVSSNMIMGPAEFTLSSMTVRIEGMPAVRMGDTLTTNQNNTIALDSVPSQVTVMVMS